VFNFLTLISRMFLLILQQIFLIFLIFEKFPCLVMHCSLRNTPFMAHHYIRDVSRARDAASVFEVNCRLGMSEICYLSIFTIVTLSCCTGDQI
jgi:hypothetical protein